MILQHIFVLDGHIGAKISLRCQRGYQTERCQDGMRALGRVGAHHEKGCFCDQELPEIPELEHVMALENLLDFELVTDAVDRVVVELPHKVLLQNFAPRLHLEMLRSLRWNRCGSVIFTTDAHPLLATT